MKDKIKISICMGSSCFPRGNNQNLSIIQEYLESSDLKSATELSGCLCHGHCKNGSNISIDDVMYNEVEPSTVVDILSHALKKA